MADSALGAVIMLVTVVVAAVVMSITWVVLNRSRSGVQPQDERELELTAHRSARDELQRRRRRHRGSSSDGSRSDMGANV